MTGFSVFENSFKKTDENAYATVDKSINPSPIGEKLKLNPCPDKFTITTPEKPRIHPKILFNVSFSIFSIIADKTIATKPLIPSIIDAFIPVV